MQQKLLAYLKKAMAAIMSIIASLSIFGGNGDVTDKITSRPDENTVTVYNSADTVADYTLSIDASDEIHDISDLLYGIFFEDINFAADGGLYAEMVVNRSFEYNEIATDDNLHGYSRVGNSNLLIETDDPLNENNPTYLVITNTSNTLAGIANRGFLDGMAIEKDAEYDFSIYAKAINGYSGKITVRLISDGNIAGETTIDAITADWAKYEATITSSVTDTNDVYLEVLIDKGTVAVDMVSLFPETYKGHGMRIDLAEKLEALSPAFLRFPGGCIIEGWDAESAYNWKDSIGTGRDGLPLEFGGTYGDVAARKYGVNLWTNPENTEDPQPSYMSYGLGFYEYFQLAEDIGAIGVPVINCGIYCQLRGKGGLDIYSDELYLFLTNMTAIEYIRNAMKRVRKKDSSIILASQNIEDFLIPSIREFTKPLFSIPTHQFLFNAGQINPKEYMDALQVEPSEFDLIKYPERGTCLYRCGNERYLLQVIAPEYKSALFGKAGGR